MYQLYTATKQHKHTQFYMLLNLTFYNHNECLRYYLLHQMVLISHFVQVLYIVGIVGIVVSRRIDGPKSDRNIS